MSNDIFAKFIKEKRKLTGLSQSQVAETLGYTTSQFISNWERGISLPPIDTIPVLAKIYKTEVHEFLKAFMDQSISDLKDSLSEKFKKIEACDL